jgi:hypothetical protein
MSEMTNEEIKKQIKQKERQLNRYKTVLELQENIHKGEIKGNPIVCYCPANHNIFMYWYCISEKAYVCIGFTRAPYWKIHSEDAVHAEILSGELVYLGAGHSTETFHWDADYWWQIWESIR